MAKIALFYIVVHLFSVWLNGRKLTSASAFDVLQSVVLVVRYKENLISYRPVVGKWSLIAFQILRIFLLHHQTKTQK